MMIFWSTILFSLVSTGNALSWHVGNSRVAGPIGYQPYNSNRQMMTRPTAAATTRTIVRTSLLAPTALRETIQTTTPRKRNDFRLWLSSSSSSSSQSGGKEVKRRSFLSRASSSSLVAVVSSFLLPSPKHHDFSATAAVTDETNTFGDNWWKTAPTTDKTAFFEGPSTGSIPAAGTTASRNNDDDIVTIRISKQEILQSTNGLGIELGEVSFRNSVRVFVKSVLPNSIGDKAGIEPNFVLVSINGQATERTNAQGVVLILGKFLKENGGGSDMLEFQFRDPSRFRRSLASLAEGDSVTTQVAPAGMVQPGRTQTDQKYTVTQLVPPPKQCTVGAKTDDLVEISYVGSVVETGQIFDGSAIAINGQGVPGRGNDVTLYFVLGKQPMGQFPPGWDTGLYGMCVGERRRLLIPPVLAYGSTGLPRRGIPPDATLQYDITLVSVNGLSVAQ